VGDADVGTGLVELGKNTLADQTGFVSRAFSKEDNDFTKLLIGALCNYIWYVKMGTELALKFLSLNLETARADGVVLATEDAEMRVGGRGKNGDIIGDEGCSTDLRGIDDKTVI
jgi:hypothetical protein